MILYRTDLNAFTFYQTHPLVGANYGDFHIPKTWVGATTKLLDITQDRGAFCRLEAREFLPPVEEGALDIKGRPMYHIPWAIENPEAAVKAFNKYIDESLGAYLDEILDDTDHLVWDVFHSAMRLSVFPSPVSGRALQRTL